MDRFSHNKIIELQFSDSRIPESLEEFGNVLESKPPRVRIEVPRDQIPSILGSLLSRYEIDDVSVHERPLEEVIAELFSNSNSGDTTVDSEAVRS